jgi:hypothetical protein
MDNLFSKFGSKILEITKKKTLNPIPQKRSPNIKELIKLYRLTD